MSITTSGHRLEESLARHGRPLVSVRIMPGLCAAAVFLSAALVFLIEPMITKLVLPMLGGSPTVWNTCLAFFQFVLLVGYLYAHLLQRLRSVRLQAAIHGCVLASAAWVLPLKASAALGEPDAHQPILWLLGVLALSIGLPFAALSATAPLIQAWYARFQCGRAKAANPYVLYAASNVGSLMALLAYPIAIEPIFSLKSQTLHWSLGYGAFVIVLGAVATLVWPADQRPALADRSGAAADTPSLSARLSWVALAAIPSSLMLGVTTHLTSDIASAPLLWIVPLALYLVTFIIVFAAKPLLSPHTALTVQAAALLVGLMTFSMPVSFELVQAILELVCFFFTALVCHQALAARRPPVAQLTEFYLLMSLGGVIGGGFNAFLAPLLFKTVLEYPIVLASSCLARPWISGRLSRRERVLFGLGLAAAPAALASGHLVGLNASTKLILVVLVVAGFLLRDRRLPFVAACMALLVGAIAMSAFRDYRTTERSFFGIVRLSRAVVPRFGDAQLMTHGTTLHGAQLLDPANRCRPMLYYAETTPIGQVFRSVAVRKTAVTIGAIGMGAGTVAAYTRPGDSLRFFEIDPLVVRLAEDPANFTYIDGCARGRIDSVLGDARLTLAHEPDAAFDILLVDAFSSDSVPAHLLTVEAMRGYLRHIKPDGIVVMHLSNNHLELMKPAAAIAEAAGGVALRQAYRPPAEAIPMIDTAEDAIIVARNAAALAPYRQDARWKPAKPDGVGVWTDDYVNLVGALIRGIGHAERETAE